MRDEIGLLSPLAGLGNAVAQQPQEKKPAEKQKQDQPQDRRTTDPQQNKQATTALAAPDKDFAMKAAQDGMAEVALGELATKQASNAEVKQFGQKMIDDHGKANNELKDWATKKGVTLPSDMNAKQKALRDRLAKLSGADFDREYAREMVKDHDQAVALFEKQARSARDAELKAWAEKTLPALQEHQKLARDLAGKVGVKATASNKTSK